MAKQIFFELEARNRMKKGVDILVATPGRLLDFISQGIISLKNLEIFVLDEADRMLDMGFVHDVKRIIKLLPQKRQTLFSASFLEDSQSPDPEHSNIDTCP